MARAASRKTSGARFKTDRGQGDVAGRSAEHWVEDARLRVTCEDQMENRDYVRGIATPIRFRIIPDLLPRRRNEIGSGR